MNDVLIVDNNLIRKITGTGQIELFEKFYNSLQVTSSEPTDKIRIVITPAGALEFLGIRVPSIVLTNEDYFKTEFRAANRDPFDATRLLGTIVRMRLAYEKRLRADHPFSRRRLSRALQKQLEFVDPRLRQWVSEILKSNLTKQQARNLLYSRVAIDRSFLFPVPLEAKDRVHSAYLAELHLSVSRGMSYSSLRWIELQWKNFVNKIRAVDVSRSISKTDLENNLTKISKHISLKANGDFLDAEAIHTSTLGRYTDYRNEPTLFCTLDPIEPVIVRLALMKSFYFNAFQIAERTEETPAMASGIVAIYDKNINITHLVDVSKVDPILGLVSEVVLDDWIESTAERFKI